MALPDKHDDTLYHELLVVRARRGDDSAFGELISALQPVIFYYVRRLVGAEADAQDILQEVWVKAFKSLGSLRETDRFRVWLFQIAHKTAMTHLRGRYRGQRVVEQAAEHAATMGAVEPSVAERMERIHAALDRLELPFREVLTLHFLEELSVEETAEVIGIPQGTVKSRLFHARAALKKIIERKENL